MLGNTSTIKQTIFLLLSILLAYFWITTPLLNTYSLQAFSVASLGYFIVKRTTNAKLWHILPKNYSLEMVFITFAVLLLVGATGNLNSIFYSFTFINLFILTMSCEEETAIIVTMAIVLFHYSLVTSISSREITIIMTIPLMLLFFLFAKKQHSDAQVNRKIIEKEEIKIKDLANQEYTLESFIQTFLKPKLKALEELLSSENEDENKAETIKKQLSLASSESDKILEKINKN